MKNVRGYGDRVSDWILFLFIGFILLKDSRLRSHHILAISSNGRLI